MTKTKINIPKDSVITFCSRHGIRRLSFFGSVLREDFSQDSDIDVLVEFEPEQRIGLIQLARLENGLGEILGRKVDLNTPGFITKYLRNQILSEAEILYDAA